MATPLTTHQKMAGSVTHVKRWHFRPHQFLSLEVHKPIGAGIVWTRENGRDVDQLTLLDEQDQDERHKVESWRLHVLIDAGYPLPLAERLAQSGADLHIAVDLVGRQGCAPEIAAEILL